MSASVAGGGTAAPGGVQPSAAVRDRQRRLEDRVNYDELTGHFNRARLREAIERAIAAERRRPVAAALMAVGIDRMAALNERLGRDAGDTVLIEIGSRLDDCLRVSDLIGRLGGDRYGILLPQCSEADVPAAAQKILEAVRAAPVATLGGPAAVTVSIGVASFCDRGSTAHEIIGRAETALADAKAAGRDCHVHFRADATLRESEDRGTEIAEAVQAALRQNRIAFAFQPVVSAQSGAVEYYECLLRLRDETGRLQPAGEFIEAVERVGSIRLVDRHILGMA
ncbi:MAG: diguanylate cyclase, partial [Alphaproteobacteria bacterium]|nr:diguanylate cyclase [Alphaproteobacteria bacterium]